MVQQHGITGGSGLLRVCGTTQHGTGQFGASIQCVIELPFKGKWISSTVGVIVRHRSRGRGKTRKKGGLRKYKNLNRYSNVVDWASRTFRSEQHLLWQHIVCIVKVPLVWAGTVCTVFVTALCNRTSSRENSLPNMNYLFWENDKASVEAVVEGR